MKILIHGRKNGYTILYPKPTPPEFYSFASDIQSGSATNDSIYYGKKFYTLAFTEGGCIFTKYVFGDDVERGQLGEIGISVFMPSNQKLSGSEVKNLLDELVNVYCGNYIANNRIVEPQTSFDWLLFTTTANSYDAKLRSVPADDVENHQQGTKEASFVLYASETELQRYFDAPYQEEYRDFKQIFFLEQNAQELLKLIKHDTSANLTGKIDLDNPKYRLLFNSQAQGNERIKVEIKRGDSWSERSNRNKIRRKDIMQISYSQPYRITETIQGTWNEIKNQRTECVSVDDANSTVSINPIRLREQQWVVAVNTLDETTNNPIAANITCTNRYKNLSNPVINNQVTFIGNDIGEQWVIKVEASGYKIEEQSFVLEAGNIITFNLKKQKIIEIQALDKDTNHPITNPKISVYEGRRDRRPHYHLENQPNKVVFVGREIERVWYLEVEAANYYDKNMGRFCPNKEGDVITVPMEKRRQTIYQPYENRQNDNSDMTISFEARKHGKLINYTYHTKTVKRQVHDDIIQEYSPECKPDLLYKFNRHWDITKPHDENNRYIYVAKFEPIIPTNIIMIGVLSILLAALIGVGWWYFFGDGSKTQPQQPPSSVQYIEQYTQGDALLSDRLDVYKAQLEKESKKETKEIISKFVWWNPLTWFDKSEEKVTVQTDSVALNALQKVEAALTLHTAIKNGECDEIINYPHYSEQQNKFKNVLQKENLCDILKKIEDRDKLPLAVIAEKVNALSQQLETQQEVQHKEEKKVEQPPVEQKPTPPEPKPNPKDESVSTSDKKSEIIQYLNSDDLSEDKLMEYQRQSSGNLEKSIELCLKLWSLNGSNDNSYSWMQSQIDKNSTQYSALTNSALKRFLDKMCNKDQTPSPKYWNQIMGNRTKSKTLKNIETQR
jgi:hypothetical protein